MWYSSSTATNNRDQMVPKVPQVYSLNYTFLDRYLLKLSKRRIFYKKIKTKSAKIYLLYIFFSVRYAIFSKREKKHNLIYNKICLGFKSFFKLISIIYFSLVVVKLQSLKIHFWACKRVIPLFLTRYIFFF